MRVRGIILLSALSLTLVLTLLATSSAIGCDPTDDILPVYCAKITPVTPTQRPLGTPTNTPQPKGDSPFTAQTPTGSWQFVGPRTSIWYKMQDAGLQLTIWVDANGQKGLDLAVYAPDQRDLYGKPIGRGAFNKFEPAHDLFWTGRSRATGVWYALVTNNSQSPIQYSINYSRSKHSVADRCAECHGSEIQWWDCYPPDSEHCKNLWEEYNKH